MPRQKSSGPTVTGDAREALHVIERLQKTGIDVSSVSVGNCRIELRQAARAATREDAAAVQPTPLEQMYEQFGGELYRRTRGTTGRPVPQTVAGEEYQPAIETE